MAKKRYRRKEKPDLMEIWIGLFLVLYMLFPGFHGYSKISPSKTWLFYGFMGLLLVLGAWLLIRDIRQKSLQSLTWPQITALLFLVCTLVSAAWSPYPDKAWYNDIAHEAALTVCLYVLLFVIVSRWGMPTERLFKVLFWSLACFCVICVLQMLSGNPLGLYPSGLNFYDGYGVKYKGAYAGTLGNVDIVSAILALAVPMLLLHSLGQKAKQGWPCWVLAAFCVAVMFWIRVLCGLVGLAMGAVICLLVLCPDKQRKWLLLIVAVLGVLGVALLWFADLPIGFLHELHEMLHGRFEDSFGTGRIYIWRQMLERIPDRLFTGVGPDAARFSELSPFIRYDEAGNIAARATITDAHCYPLHILYCQGLPALLCWLATVGQVMVHWGKARRDRAVMILGGGLACFLCAMLFCFSSVIIMPFFWLSMALLEAAYQKKKQGG